MSKAVLIAAIGLALTSPLSAVENLVGQLAPSFTAEENVFPPRFTKSDELFGEVILLEFWGIT